jgi:hypothetical protein
MKPRLKSRNTVTRAMAKAARRARGRLRAQPEHGGADE